MSKVAAGNDELLEFVRSEYSRVSKYSDTIQATRDRYFSNYMTVAVALLGGLGLILKDVTSDSGTYSEAIGVFAQLSVIAILFFGVGTSFVLCGNLVARDYYRERRKRLLAQLVAEHTTAGLREFVQQYIDFSRDQVPWRYRASSIYFVYNSAIGAANTVCSMTFPSFAGYRVSPAGYVLWFVGGLCAQHALCALYLKMYTSKSYQE